MGQDVGQAHVLLPDTLRTDRSARPYRVIVSMWWRITFKIKTSEIPKLRTSFIAYTGQRRRLQIVLDESHFVKRNINNYEAYIPLKSLVGHTEFRWDELKEVRFIILNDVPFEIGDFKIIEFRGNPKKPTEWKGI